MAKRSHGVVTRAQLLDSGISPAQIDDRLANGSLLREHRGVYRVGHRAPSTEARYMAAVRACGPDANLSGLAAAYLLGLLKGKAPKPEVTARGKRCIPGVRTRRGRLGRDETTIWRGIPVTNVPRTLVDLAPYLPIDELARAFHEANVKHGTRPDQVEAVLARCPNSPGAAKLRAVLRGEVRVTQSKLERRVLNLFRAHGFELPETNCPAGSYRVDCRWPKQGLTIEIDSYTYHRTSHAWEQDRRREREAYARGDHFRRYTPNDVEHPRQMLEELSALLPRRRRRTAGARARSGRARPCRARSPE